METASITNPYVNINFPVALLKKFSQQRIENQFCDVIVKANGGRYVAHSCVIAACSPVLGERLTQTTQTTATLEDGKKEIILDGYDDDILKKFLDYCYSGEILLTETNVKEALKLATHLQMSDIINYCTSVLEMQISTKNCFKMHELGETYGLLSLSKKANAFLYLHMLEVIEENEILHFDFHRVCTLLSNRTCPLTEEAKLHIMCRWVNHDSLQRVAMFEPLLTRISWERVSLTVFYQVVQSEPLLTDNELCLYHLFKLMDKKNQLVDVYKNTLQMLEEKFSNPQYITASSEPSSQASDDASTCLLSSDKLDAEAAIRLAEVELSNLRLGSPEKPKGSFKRRVSGRSVSQWTLPDHILSDIDFSDTETLTGDLDIDVMLNSHVDLDKEGYGSNDILGAAVVHVGGSSSKGDTICAGLSTMSTLDLDRVNIGESMTALENIQNVQQEEKSSEEMEKNTTIQTSEDSDKRMGKRKKVDHPVGTIEKMATRGSHGIRKRTRKASDEVMIDVVHISPPSTPPPTKQKPSKSSTLKPIKKEIVTGPPDETKSPIIDPVDQFRYVNLRISRKQEGNHKEKKTCDKRAQHLCLLCSFSTRSLKRFQSHKCEGAETKTYPCDLCEHVCQHNREMHKHMKRHFPIPPYKCDHENCPYTTTHMASFINHRNRHCNERPHTCSECMTSFRTKNNLTAHMKCHSGSKPFQCGTCQKCFATKGTLEQHVVTHSDLRPYLCDTCGFSTKYQSHLISHKRIHTGDVFHCQYEGCKYFTPKRSQLGCHMRSHMSIRQYKCCFCEKAFIEKNHLVRHERIHRNDKPYMCDQCPYSSVRSDKLRHHVKKHHSGEPVEHKSYSKRLLLPKDFASSLIIDTGDGANVMDDKHQLFEPNAHIIQLVRQQDTTNQNWCTMLSHNTDPSTSVMYQHKLEDGTVCDQAHSNPTTLSTINPLHINFMSGSALGECNPMGDGHGPLSFTAFDINTLGTLTNTTVSDTISTSGNLQLLLAPPNRSLSSGDLSLLLSGGGNRGSMGQRLTLDLGNIKLDDELTNGGVITGVIGLYNNSKVGEM